MSQATRIFGLILVVLGVVYFVATGSAHPTALIPAAFGFVLFLLGILANTNVVGRRMLFMHIAVTVGLLGCLFPAVRGGMMLARSASLTRVQHIAAQEQIIMAVICGIFTAVCIRSFVMARIARSA